MEKKEFKIPWTIYILLFPLVCLVNLVANLKGAPVHVGTLTGFYDSPLIQFIRLPNLLATFGKLINRLRYFFWYVEGQFARLLRMLGLVRPKMTKACSADKPLSPDQFSK